MKTQLASRAVLLGAMFIHAPVISAQIMPRAPTAPPTVYAGTAPVNFRVASTTPVSANLAWDITPGAMTYTVLRTTGVGQPWTTLTATPISASSLAYTDNGPIDYRNTYIYRLQANYSSGPPGYTDLTVTLAKPVNPEGFTAKQSGEGAARLTWNVVSGVPAYTVFGPGIPGGAMTVNSTSLTATGLPLGSHSWTVASVYQPNNITTPASEFPSASAAIEKWVGSYRVYLIGFTNQTATVDDAVNADGVGDEIMPEVYWQRFTLPDGRMGGTNWARASVHGDNGKSWKSRVRAGSGQPNGGILGNDIVPAGFLNTTSASSGSGLTSPATSTGTKGAAPIIPLPMTVWEGDLVRNTDVLILYPSLWEIDEQPGIFRNLYETGIASRTTDAINMAQVQQSLYQFGVSELTGALGFQFPSHAIGFPADRPIGVQAVPGRAGGSDAGFFDRMIVLTMKKIEEELSKPPKYPGLPSGTLGLSFFEPGYIWEQTPDAYNFTGRYVLYLVVERK